MGPITIPPPNPPTPPDCAARHKHEINSAQSQEELNTAIENTQRARDIRNEYIERMSGSRLETAAKDWDDIMALQSRLEDLERVTIPAYETAMETAISFPENCDVGAQTLETHLDEVRQEKQELEARIAENRAQFLEKHSEIIRNDEEIIFSSNSDISTYMRRHAEARDANLKPIIAEVADLDEILTDAAMRRSNQ